jgi:hypothetical protein
MVAGRYVPFEPSRVVEFPVFVDAPLVGKPEPVRNIADLFIANAVSQTISSY